MTKNILWPEYQGKKVRRSLSWNIKMLDSVSGGYGDYA